MVSAANSMHTCTIYVFLYDYTPRTTIPCSSFYNGSCQNLLMNVYKDRSANRNGRKHVFDDILIPTLLLQVNKHLTPENTCWLLREACERAFTRLLKLSYLNRLACSYLKDVLICHAGMFIHAQP